MLKTDRKKSEQIGVFPKQGAQIGINGEIGTNRDDFGGSDKSQLAVMNAWLLGIVFSLTVCSLSGPVLRDTARVSQRYPPIARYGVLVSQHGQLGAIPPPPFLSVSPLESNCMQSGGAIPHENKANGCDTPSAILSRKGIVRYGGGVSRTGPLSLFFSNTKGSTIQLAIFFFPTERL